MIVLRKKLEASDPRDVDRRLTEAERQTRKLELRVKRIELEVGIIGRALRRQEDAEASA